MIIKNITDQKTPKVIGFGPYWLMPGEEKYIPDEILYVEELDKYNRPTGKKIVLPAVTMQEKLGMLKIETPKEAEPADAVEPDPVSDAGEDEQPELSDEEKKAETAAKRKAAREAKKAAEAAAKAAAESKAE